MKIKSKLIALIALGMALLGGKAFAHGNWEEHHRAGNSSGMNGSMHADGMMGGYGGMGMMMGQSPEQLSDDELDRMAEYIREMHIQAARIAAADDPAERRELVRQHLSSMQNFMHQRMDGNSHGAGHWRDGLEERVRHMEEMMKQR
jgi:hypothetical protein